jgi:hypothetical protein
MAKRKRTKGQTTIYKTLHRKRKIEHTSPTKPGCFGRVSSFCSTNYTASDFSFPIFKLFLTVKARSIHPEYAFPFFLIMQYNEKQCTFPKSDRNNSRKRHNRQPHKYMIAHFPGLVRALLYKVAELS